MTKDAMWVEASERPDISESCLSAGISVAPEKGATTEINFQRGNAILTRHSQPKDDAQEQQPPGDVRGIFSYIDFQKLVQAHTCAGFS